MRRGILVTLVMICVGITVFFIRYQQTSKLKSTTKEEKTIVLSVLAGQSTTDAGIEDIIDEALSKKFPNVHLEWECVDWGEKFDLQMQARFASGDIPDIIVGKAQDVYAYSSLGNLAPIPSECIDKIEEKALQAVTVDGEVYGLPYNSLYQGVIYNKNIFKKYHLTPPTTRAELAEIVTTLSKSKVTPFAAHFLENWEIGNMTMQFFVNDIFNHNADWGELFRNNKVSFQNNEIVENSLKQNQYILSNSWRDVKYVDQYECDKRFDEGKAAMYLTGTWWLQSVNSESSKKAYGIFPYPNLTGDSDLIQETNITFMKSNTSNYAKLIDEIFKELVTNKQLIQNVLDFTQTYSVIKGMKPEYDYCIDSDISHYKSSKQVVEVTADNNQLLWSYQNDLAMKQQDWLKGKITLEEVLEYADKKRQDSSN